MARIVYHTRDVNGNKISGGAFGGEFSQSTVDRLIDRHFSFAIGANDAKPHLVDRQGRRVTLYIEAQLDKINTYQAVLKEHKKQTALAAFEASKCKRKEYYNGHLHTCASIYNCCDCGGNNCGCAYCWSCNACEYCLSEEE